MQLLRCAEHAGLGEQVYVHCKAGRGRSTTLVICYLVSRMHMAPEDAYAFVRAKRPQVCLADAQWAAVREVRAAAAAATHADATLLVLVSPAHVRARRWLAPAELICQEVRVLLGGQCCLRTRTLPIQNKVELKPCHTLSHPVKPCHILSHPVKVMYVEVGNIP